MKVKVVIEYMDGRMADGEDKLVHHVFGEGDENSGSGADTGEQTTVTCFIDLDIMISCIEKVVYMWYKPNNMQRTIIRMATQ